MDYSNQNLQKASFKNRDLSNAVFTGSDLRGADFSGSMLVGADFSHSRTGITTANVVVMFVAALVVSFLSGYIAMLAGNTMHQMLDSNDPKIHASGIITIILTVIFIGCFYWKGGSTIRNLALPTCIFALLVGLVNYLIGYGTGMGMVYLVLVIFLITAMLIVGTISRESAGTLSSTILFFVVALGGGIFGRGVGGGIGTIVMALSCALISKRALSGAKGFNTLRKFAFSITRKFGTSFKYANLTQADFSESKMHNTDFTDAEVTLVNWNNAKIENCISGTDNFTVKENQHD
jgi:hypothetical protein